MNTETMGSDALVHTSSVEDLINQRDEILTTIYHKLRPVTEAIRRYHESEEVFVEEVYAEQHTVVLFVKVCCRKKRPISLVLTVPVKAVNDGSMDDLYAYLATSLVEVPDAGALDIDA